MKPLIVWSLESAMIALPYFVHFAPLTAMQSHIVSLCSPLNLPCLQGSKSSNGQAARISCDCRPVTFYAATVSERNYTLAAPLPEGECTVSIVCGVNAAASGAVASLLETIQSLCSF